MSAIQKNRSPSRLGRGWLVCVSLLISFGLFSTNARSDEFPSRPIRIISGLPTGTAGDITARVLGARMSQTLGQPVVVENRTGAGSSLGAAAVARSPNDGYTLFVGAIANVINAIMNPNLTFDFEKDFAPIALLSTTPLILVVHPSLGVTNVKELMELARAKPDSIAFASSGPATTTHLAIELLKLSGQVKILHVPYTGSPQAVTDLLAGRIQGYFSPASTVMEQVRAGKVVALASTEAKRSASAPDLPTMIESGVPDFSAGIWSGLMAPAGTDPVVIRKLADAANEAVRFPEVVAAFKKLGIDPLGSSPEEFRQFIRSELNRWAAVVAHAGLKK